MRYLTFKNVTLFFLVFVALVVFIKPYHSHKLSTQIMASDDHTVVNEDTHYDVQHKHSQDCESDCGSDCACPFHRVNGCSPMTALAKMTRFDLLDLNSSPVTGTIFLAKTSPVLDGPFRPPLV